jgi:carboxylesterase type B
MLCRYLNLWLPNRPAPPVGQGYSAMIFFYGGSWTTGSAMFPLYTGEALTVSSNATVVITVNYRLTAFGFLGSDLLRGDDNSTGNFGLQDQRQAMRWLRDNADLLHVDPARVMIFGESAGAGSVSSHLVSHRSRGLFTRAAMESGPFADWTSVQLDEGKQKFQMFCENLGCPMPPANASASSPEAAQLRACLRSRNMTQVLDATKHLPSSGLVDWSPTVDGVEFTDDVRASESRMLFGSGVPPLSWLDPRLLLPLPRCRCRCHCRCRLCCLVSPSRGTHYSLPHALTPSLTHSLTHSLLTHSRATDCGPGGDACGPRRSAGGRARAAGHQRQ